MKTGYQFSISDLPKRCEAVAYGIYLFDGNDMDDTYMYKADEGNFFYIKIILSESFWLVNIFTGHMEWLRANVTKINNAIN